MKESNVGRSPELIEEEIEQLRRQYDIEDKPGSLDTSRLTTAIGQRQSELQLLDTGIHQPSRPSADEVIAGAFPIEESTISDFSTLGTIFSEPELKVDEIA